MDQHRHGLFWLDLLIVVLAGAWTLFHIIWTLAGQTADDYWGIALLVLFVLALIVAFVHFAQERAALQAVSPTEPFPEPAISRFFLASVGSSALWFVVRMDVGAQWLLAGWDKVTSPAWGTSGKALSGFVAGAFFSQILGGQSCGARMVCLVFTTHGASQCRLVLVPGYLG